MKWQRPRAGDATRHARPQIVADDGRPLDAYTSGPSDAAPVLPPGHRRAVTARVVVMLVGAVAGVAFLAGPKLTGQVPPAPSVQAVEAQAEPSVLAPVVPIVPIVPVGTTPPLEAISWGDQATPQAEVTRPGATIPPPP